MQIARELLSRGATRGSRSEAAAEVYSCIIGQGKQAARPDAPRPQQARR
jgi:hypothetical protein